MTALRWTCGLALVLPIACANPPPPRWLEGGAPLVIGEASWVRADHSRVTVSATGQVTVDGEVEYGLDRVGRVVDEWNDPVAMLQPDGQLRGTGNADLGRIGWNNAAPPGRSTGWLSIEPSGAVIQLDSDGERHSDGKWTGCDGQVRRTCTLVTHMLRVLTVREETRAQKSAQDVGIYD